jgi:hypothetical protein
MRVVGIVVSILGGLLLLSSSKIALTQYNFSSPHAISKAMGGFAAAILVLALGLYLFQRGGKPTDKPRDP